MGRWLRAVYGSMSFLDGACIFLTSKIPLPVLFYLTAQGHLDPAWVLLCVCLLKAVLQIPQISGNAPPQRLEATGQGSRQQEGWSFHFRPLTLASGWSPSCTVKTWPLLFYSRHSDSTNQMATDWREGTGFSRSVTCFGSRSSVWYSFSHSQHPRVQESRDRKGNRSTYCDP